MLNAMPDERVECYAQEEGYFLSYVDTSGKAHNMVRKRTEIVGRTLERLMKKLKLRDPLQLFGEGGGTPLPTDTPNEGTWERAASILLNARSVPVILNPPRINTGELSSDATHVGVPITPSVQLEASEGITLLYEWSISGSAAGAVLSRESVFTPQEEAEGVLQVAVTPVHEGRGIRGSPFTLKALRPTKRLAESVYRKYEHWGVPAADGLRVATYNVLADCFAAGSDYGRDVMYSHVPIEFLEMEYRFNVILLDIVKMNPDLISLQEVGHTFFRRMSYILEAALGHTGWHCLKLGNGTEGCAVFYRKSRFEVLERTMLPLGGNVDEIPFAPDVKAPLCAHPVMREKFRYVVSVLQLMVLRDLLKDRVFTYANTHLYYHPDGNIIRALQLHTIYYQAQKRELEKHMLLTGDLNTAFHPFYIREEPGASEQSGVAECDFQTASGEAVSWKRGPANQLSVNGVEVGRLAFSMRSSVLECYPVEGGGEPQRFCLGVSDDRTKLRKVLSLAAPCKGVDVSGLELVVPPPAAQRLMDGHTIEADDRDWAFTDAEGGDASGRLRLALTLPFELANPNRDIDYTTHTADFTEVLDYTLYAPHFLCPVRIMPRIDFELLRETLPGFPNEDHPSDHIPVFVDFAYAEAAESAE